MRPVRVLVSMLLSACARMGPSRAPNPRLGPTSMDEAAQWVFVKIDGKANDVVTVPFTFTP